MLGILRKIHGSIHRFNNRTSKRLLWKAAVYRYRYSSKSISTVSLDTDGTFLILAPHSDDEWIGCSQIIQNCPKAVICNMDMGGGDSADIHKQRREEMASLAERFGKRFTTLGKDKVSDLREIIQKEQPSYVLVPHYMDWHPEHFMVMNYLKQVVQDDTFQSIVLTYQVSVPIVARENIVCFPLTKQQLLYKWQVFADIYKTQEFMPVERFMANERINGAIASKYAAEIYVMHDADGWVQSMERFESKCNDRNLIKNNFNDISCIRSILSRFNS